MSKTTPHPVDVHVGVRLRQRRTQLGMSQSAVAEAAGISFQQVQRYENGSNRCRSSMLWTFAQALGVEPGYFFEELKRGETKPDPDSEQLSRRETLALTRGFYGLSRPRRNAVRALMRSLAAA